MAEHAPQKGSLSAPGGGEGSVRATWSPLRSLQGEALRPDQPVRIRREARDFLVERVDPFAVIDVDDRQVLEEDLRGRSVVLEALALVVHGARRLELLVDLLAAIVAV